MSDEGYGIMLEIKLESEAELESDFIIPLALESELESEISRVMHHWSIHHLITGTCYFHGMNFFLV